MRYGGLIAAVVFAAIAAIIVMRMSGGDAPAPAVAAQSVEQKTVNVYIAAKPISIGSTLTAEDVAAQPWPAHLALEGFVIADGKTNVVGMVARSPFQISEPLINAKLANPNDPNFLAGDLPAGMRVVTIPINEFDGVAGFIFPGDAVDVIFTHDVDKWETPPTSVSQTTSQQGNSSVSNETKNSAPQKIKVTVTETLLTNVKVLAVDQRPSSAGATNDKGGLIIPRSASLMVSQLDAQRVRLANKTGTLSLTLRSLADKESADPLLLTTKEDVTQSKSGAEDMKDSEKMTIKIVRGAPALPKEVQSSGSTTARGAPATSGTTTTGSPTTSTTSGSSAVTPGLMAIP